MQTRELGRSGIEASVVGLGTWVTGGWMWGGSEESDGIAAIRAALDSGITLIDTAPIYGFGRSEEILGRAIEGRRDEVVLATKCGMTWQDERSSQGLRGGDKFFDTDDEHPGEGDREVFKHLRPDSVRDELERSLARLRTDRIDLYQTHWQESTTAIEDTMACLLELKAAGKVRAIGCSNVTDDELRAYDAAGRADVDQDKYSMLDRGPDETRLGLCRELGVSFLAYSPLALGLLTGKVKPDATFPSGDLRSRRERFSAENLTRVQSMLDELRPIAERLGLTLAQLAIAWTVSRPGLTHALVGARTPDQARANARAGERLLDEGEAAEITAIVDRHRDGIV